MRQKRTDITLGTRTLIRHERIHTIFIRFIQNPIVLMY